MKIAEMSWVQFKEANLDKAIIPVGAVEVYGPHLPMGADGIVASRLAEAVAEKLDILVAPLVPVGFSLRLSEFPGTLTVGSKSLKNYVNDLTEILIKWGVKKILFINGHNGNVPILGQVALENQYRYLDLTFAQVDVWRFIQPHADDLMDTKEFPHGHASEAGTSLLMYLVPELVKMEKALREVPKKTNSYPEILQYINFSVSSKSGILGDPRGATPKKGEEIFHRSVQRILDFISQWG